LIGGYSHPSPLTLKTKVSKGWRRERREKREKKRGK